MTEDKLKLTSDGQRFLVEWLDNKDFIIAHTSGSTGEPKEIRLLKSDMRESARATNRFFEIGESSVLVCPLSAKYIAGKMMIVRSLEADCRLIMEEPSNAPLKAETIDLIGANERIALLPIVPSQIEGFISSPYKSLVDNAIVGGAPVSGLQERKMVEEGINAYSTFGMTETCSHVALRKFGYDCYVSLPGFSFETDERGCLAITSERMSFGRLQTNDVVDLQSVSSFRWLGRADNVVISGGLKFFPETIEKKIEDVMPVPFFIAGEPSDKWGQQLVIFAELPDAETEMQTDMQQQIMAQVIREILQTKLEHLEMPKRLYFRNQLPRTKNGKLRRTSE